MEKQSRLMMWMVVLVPVLAAVLAILPPEQKLKAGIDLAGGFSLLYEIDTTGLSASDIRARGGLANRVIEVLRKRVDPNAQMNLIWRAVGNTRLEIQMPRPPGRAAERRRQKDAAFNAIQERNIGRVEIEMALGAPPAERQERLDQLIRDVPERQPLLATLAQAYDAYRQAQESDDLDAEDRAQAAYEQAFDAVLKTSLSPDRVADVLGLLPGKERTEQLGALKNEHPSYARLIEDAEAKYAEWAQDKSFLEDPSDLKRLLRGAGVLEFRILADRDPENPSRTRADDPSLRQSITDYLQQLQQFGPRPKAGDRYRWFEIDNIKSFLYLDSMDQLENYTQTGQQVVAKYAGKWYVLAHDDPTYGLIKSSKNRWKLKSALPTRDENGRPAVSFRLDPRGGSQFRTMTGHNIERQMAIMLDDVAMSQAVIKSRIGERGQISGSTFTPEKVRNLVQTLEAGSLPGRLKETPLMEKNVGPSLGLANREMGLKAAVYGLIVVAAFILIYYMFAGMVANVALFLNLLFVLGIMAMMEATFTLPGIAGLILTVGMAVDANVLIFERIREEREKGSVLKRAIKTGYEKALSTIVDANLTTLITCVVLGYLGSEEVKGFAMTLGFGIVTSMFTALFVTRLIFLTLMDRGWLNDLKMFKLIGRHDIDWLALRTKFWPVSMVLVIGGMSLFGFASATDTESVYDIEFLGGTSVQIELKPGVNLSDDDIRRRITSENGDSNSSAVVWLRQAADALKQSTVKPGKTSTQFVMTSDTLIAEQITALMLTKGRRQKDALVDRLEVGGVSAEGNTCRFDTRPVPVPAVGDADPGERPMTLEEFQKAVADAADYALKAAQNLSTSRIQTVFEMGEQADANAKAFEIITVETNKQLVQEAVLACLGDDLAIERPINFVRVTDDTHPQGFYPIDEDAHYLSDVIGGQANFDVRRYKGGVVLQFDQLDPPQTIAELDKRIREIRLQAGFGEGKWRSYGLFGLTGAGGSGDDERFSKVALTVVDEDLPYYEDVDLWRLNVATPEAEQATAALQSEKALRKVVQFAPQVAEQTKNQAILAVAVALAAIVAYVGFRFGSMLFGLAAIVALVHDVSITLGLITLSDYFRGGTLGRVFLIQDFKIDLPMIAAMLTIIGYSLNDTIVVFDRIRENRGKMAVLKAKTINTSINQTLSRTLLTSITTFMVVAIMYWLGGPGVHGFAFALVVGIMVGTYSSIGVATPLLYRPKTLHVVVYALIALGIVGAVAVMSNDLTVLGIVGAVVGLALIWAITTELRSERDYGGMAASPA